MNKTVKGAVALGAAAFILLGGAGTLAYWTDAQAADAGTVSTGHLRILSGESAWSEVKTADGTTPTGISDIGAYNLVPGDTVKYTETFTVDAEGDNLKANLQVWAADAVLTDGTVAIADDLDVTAVATIDDGDLSTEPTVLDLLNEAGAGDKVLTEANDGDVITVEVTVAFAETAQASEDVNLVLRTLEIVLAQVSA